MKKLIFSILSLGVLLISSASADGFCQNWEAGQIIRPDQPNGSVAPKPYCWQVSDLSGAVNIGGTMYIAKELKVQGRNDSYYNFYGFDEDYAYGEMYYGVYVFAEVYGFPQNTPIVTFNNLSAILKGTDDVKSLSGNILNGTRYKFFIPIKTVASTAYWSDIDLSGRVNIFDGVNLKREFTIF
jgi:hypothetical protein